MSSSLRFTRRTLLGVAAMGLGGAVISSVRAQSVAPSHPTPGTCLTNEEQTMAYLINDYRRVNGLPIVPVSKSLSLVAQWHVVDLRDNNAASGRDSRGLPCNTHSWSNRGFWSPVCYTADHTYAEGMWNKPKEITNNVYTDTGYEIAFGGGTNFVATPENALEGWKGSPPHNAVLLNQEIWRSSTWKAMGVGLYANYAVVWFGEMDDPLGTYGTCQPAEPQNERIYLPAIQRA